MNIRETGQLLAQCAVFDQRSIGEADILGWQAIVPEMLEFDDCAQAVIAHYRHSRERIMPKDLISRAHTVRARRTGQHFYEEL